MAERDWADHAASVLWALNVTERARMLRDEPQGEVYATCDDIRKVYELGHAIGAREATTWRDPVADPPEVPEGERGLFVVCIPADTIYHRPEVSWYSREGWSVAAHAWLPIPPLPKVTP